jgi:hypothetical protein
LLRISFSLLFNFRDVDGQIRSDQIRKAFFDDVYPGLAAIKQMLLVLGKSLKDIRVRASGHRKVEIGSISEPQPGDQL